MLQQHPASALVRAVTVFCGSQDGNLPIFTKKAHDMGQILAENKKRLVYGGGSFGCMGTLAKACVSHGGAVSGVIPRFLLEKEGHSGFLNQPPHELIIVEGDFTDAMARRKKEFFLRGDVVVTLPGGWGTDDEEFEGLTYSKLGRIVTPHVLVNLNGFWNSKLDQTREQVKLGFVSEEQAAKRIIVNDIDEVLPAAYEAIAKTNNLTSASADVIRLGQGRATAR